MTIIEILIVFAFRHVWAKLFSDDPVLDKMLITVLNIWFALLIPDNLQHIFQGTFKALKKGGPMLWAYFLVYYPVGLPFTIWLAFSKKWYTNGLWLGFALSVIVVIIIFCAMLATTDIRT